jgi:hypothetical protein
VVFLSTFRQILQLDHRITRKNFVPRRACTQLSVGLVPGGRENKMAHIKALKFLELALNFVRVCCPHENIERYFNFFTNYNIYFLILNTL